MISYFSATPTDKTGVGSLDKGIHQHGSKGGTVGSTSTDPPVRIHQYGGQIHQWIHQYGSTSGQGDPWTVDRGIKRGDRSDPRAKNGSATSTIIMFVFLQVALIGRCEDTA